MSNTFGWIDGKPYDFTYKKCEHDLIGGIFI